MKIKLQQLGDLLLISVVVASFFGIYNYFSTSVIGIVGLFLTITGLVIWGFGKKELGDAFSAMPKAKKLVTRGVYSKIRNPIYVGISLVLVGWSLLMNSLLMWIITLAITVSSVIRAHLEAKVLYQKFGKEYLEYRKRTWF